MKLLKRLEDLSHELFDGIMSQQSESSNEESEVVTNDVEMEEEADLMINSELAYWSEVVG